MFFTDKENTNIDFELTKDERKQKTKKIMLVIMPIVLILVIGVGAILFITLTKPTIELQGGDTITIPAGSNYYEPGYKAYDKSGNDLTDEVKVTDNIDTSKEGEYKITYSLKTAKVTRIIKVIEAIDDTNIQLNGDMIMYLTVGEKYIEPGYKAYDSIDTTDLTDKVTVTGEVNSLKVGTYQLTYSVVNSRNKTTTIKRTIIVREKTDK